VLWALWLWARLAKDKAGRAPAAMHSAGVSQRNRMNVWQSYKQERDCLMHFARLGNTLLKDEESA